MSSSSDSRKTLFLFRIFTVVLPLMFIPDGLFSWGFFSHKKINHMAVFTLPPEMIGLYKRHIEYLTMHAVDPDMRRMAIKGEAERHYIDIDHYGAHPFDSVPRWWKKAVAKYTEDTLRAYGILPWNVDWMVMRLTEAFKESDLEKILKTSADMGHYIADAHVPLHCTENYNGQMTNQIGIHGFWESRLPELFADEYDFFAGRASYVDKPIDYVWNIIRESYAEKDTVLLFETQLNASFPKDRKFGYENRGQNMARVYSADYSEKYHSMLNGMVERRMKSAVRAVGNLWYTAWVNAGQPDLRIYYDKNISDEFFKKQKEEEELWQKGKLNVRDHSE